jgi:hypothetical protein
MTDSPISPPVTLKLQSMRGYMTSVKRGKMNLRPSQKKGNQGLGDRLGAIGEFFERTGDLIQQGQNTAFSVSRLFQSITQTVGFLWNFNWNASDEQIQKQIDGLVKNLAVQTAGALGQTVAAVVCGAVPGQLLVKFDAPLMARLASAGGISKYDPSKSLAATVNTELKEHVLDELCGTYASLYQAAQRASKQAQFLWLYRDARAFLKNSGLAEKFLGKDFAKKWGADDAPPLTMSGKYEEAIEKLPDFWKDIAEEFVENIVEGCQEFLAIGANAADSWLAYQRQFEQKSLLGRQRTIRVKPHADSDETFELTGAEEVLKPTLTQALSFHQMVDRRDIGDFVGTPFADSVRRSPRELWIVIQYSTYEFGESSKGGIRARYTPTYSIPVTKPNLNWDAIKAAAGRNGYIYGPVRVTYLLEDPKGYPGGQLAVYAATEKEAEERLQAFLTLSDFKMVGRSAAEEKEGGRRSKAAGNLKEKVKVFPAYFSVGYKKKIQKMDKGRQELGQSGRTSTRRSKIELWPAQKPPDADARIQELLRLGS